MEYIFIFFIFILSSFGFQISIINLCAGIKYNKLGVNISLAVNDI